MNPNPFEFSENTPAPVRDVIQALYENKHRARFFFGDLSTGTAWPEEHDIMGTVGKSTGPRPCPLLVNNARSMGGGALISAIVKVIDLTTGRTLYEHEHFSNPADQLVILSTGTTCEVGTPAGEVWARFSSKNPEKSARRWIEFMQGKRHAK